MKRARALAFLWMMTLSATAQTTSPGWRIYLPNGDEAGMDALVRRAADVDVLLVAEVHDDTVGHRFQLEMLTALDGGARSLSLSLEMFERDVQLVVDEYLAGLITEAHFRSSSRPWPEYDRDYRPLVEYARERGLPVVAANPPRRYVNMVAREGIASLSRLFGESRAFLPEVPLPAASDRYRDAFFEYVGGMPAHGNGPDPDDLFDAQRLWDAGMAEAIARQIDRYPEHLVMHIAGAFHIERDMGIPDMLRAYRPHAASLIVAVRPGERFEADVHGDLGDFIVLTAGQ